MADDGCDAGGGGAAHAGAAGDDVAAYQRAGGHIDRLEVDNFKSYRGHQQIGPFKQFTAIVGPNGSGKSNLMDAISFVLGVKTAQLRGSLRELLYGGGGGDAAAGGSDQQQRPSRGHVKLVYVTEEGEEVSFSRVIQPSGSQDGAYTSVYKVDGRTVPWEAYSRRLAGYGILVKVRNFLVFQGDIEKVASRSPEQLTQLFEQVSGSDALAKPYEEAAAAKVRAEEQAMLLFAKKKTVAAERKQKKEQKDEAERHMAALEEQRQRRTYYFLWQLFHLQQDESAALQQQQELADELAQLTAANASYDKDLEERRRAQSSIIRERMSLEKEQKRLQKRQEKKDPGKARLHEEEARTQRKIASAQTELDNLKRAAKAQAKRLAKARKDLAQLQDARAQLDAQGVEGGLQLDPAQLEEYRRLKGEADVKAGRLLQDMSAAEAKLKVEEGKLARLRQEGASKAARLDAQRERLGALRGQLEAAQGELGELERQLAAKKDEAKAAAAEHRKTSSQRDYLLGKLRELESRLAASKSMRQATEREKRLQAAAARLKQEVPGVFGRVSELVRVPNRKYNLAMAVVMQQHLDSVVVADRAAGFACVDFLKGSKMERMDFIPLDSCEARPLPERLRHLGGTATPAIDLLTFEPQHERAVVHVCGSTLVVDEVDEARRLCYSPDRHKVVTCDGTLFKPNGTFTGGRSAGVDARANRWDAEEYAKLKEEREELKAQIDALPDVRSSSAATQALAVEQSGLEQRIRYKKADVQHTQEELQRVQRDVQLLEQAASASAGDQQLPLLESSVERQRAALAAMAGRVNEVKDRLFAGFSKRVGVPNIRVYEETTLAAATKLEEEKQQYEEQIVKVSEQISYEEKRGLQQQLEDKARELEAEQGKLEQLREQESKLEEGEAQLRGQAEELARKMEELRGQAEAAGAAIKELQARAADYQQKAGRLRGNMAAAATALEAVRSMQAGLLEAATLEQVELPRLPAGRSGGRGGAEAMDVDGQPEEEDGEEGEEEGEEGGEAPRGAARKCRQVFDFSRVTPKDKAASTKKERDAIGKRLKEELDATAAELAAAAPNLKALEQYEAVRERERQQAAALEAARKEANAASKAFLRIQQQRTAKFHAAFEHIRSSIDFIYKQLTRSAVHPLGGQAYLSLEVEDEPYLGGVKYTAMPPTKRFRDMEQLSGGEKSVAALALLFAVHSYRPSPFFVLDEVDAALDATNVARVAHYIRACTRPPAGAAGAAAAGGGAKRQRRAGAGDGDGDGEPEGGGGEGAGPSQQQQQQQPGSSLESFQSIVISLKDIFYEKADALVGVCRDLDQNCSKTITFDLSRFEPPAEAA